MSQYTKATFPKKWQIAPQNLEQAKVIAKYFDKVQTCSDNPNFYESELELNLFYRRTYMPGNTYHYIPSLDYPEISFEDFKQFVLEEEPEFILPEKWAVKGGEELNKAGFRKWILNIREYDGDSTTLYYYLINNIVDAKYGAVPKGYTEITVEQWVKYIYEPSLKQQNMEKKIIGWKIKEQYDTREIGQAVKSIVNGSGDILEFMSRAGDKDYAQTLRRASVLDLWFDPIYEEEKKEVILYVGTNNTKVIIGKNSIETIHGSFSIAHITAIYNHFTSICSLNEYPVKLERGNRFIRIGCEDSGNFFSLHDLERVIEEYKKFNS